jgi:hypothetical protein
MRRIAFPMVCFCDIPLSRAGKHAQRYGRYALGLTREWATNKSISPVFYIQPDSVLASSLLAILRTSRTNQGGDAAEQYRRDTVLLHSFVKPTAGPEQKDESAVEYVDYFQESEWRHVPTDRRIPTDGPPNLPSFEESRTELHKLTRAHAMLRFEARDLQHIVVEREDEVPRLLSFLWDFYKPLTEASRHLLLSRVTSFEALERDH